MYKLIELLKQHESRMYSIYGTHLYKWSLGGEIGEIHCINELNDQEITYSELESVLKSKEYGFIKWLVENDKIDLSKLEKIGREETVYMYDGKYRKIVEYSDYESLLMLLSIQDNTIEFLVSILK